jgi:hypothetical protein
MQQRSVFSRNGLFDGRLLLLWLVMSLAWLCLLGAGVCVKAGDQVAASSDLARELAQLNCPAGATTKCAAAPGGRYGGSWSETVTTFLAYGSRTLLPIAVLPPLAAFALGFLASVVVRRRRTAYAAGVDLVPTVRQLPSPRSDHPGFGGRGRRHALSDGWAASTYEARSADDGIAARGGHS